ncbi:MAG TPA: PepSY-associated TM helix domain-containing protein [Candidatus Sulfotelmatobacter sp.]|nr:PepSY-associated TM helix domain-containing protein [Candidatus Sulfotelmatobacter sp.]
MIHRIFVVLHRYTGLVMALFLFIVGLTGSLLAFNTELERVFVPRLFAKPQLGVPRLDFATLAACAQAIVPEGRVTGVSFTEPDQAHVTFTPRSNPATGYPYTLGFDDFFLDPWTGKELGRRRGGDLSQGRINIMPFLYDLHWRLAAGDLGQWILGIVAVVWSIDCFVGFYLTLPQSSGGFWRRWRYAWRVKWAATAFRVNFDLHRAGGLWVWAMLFIFAWSSVMMNIRPLYECVMSVAFSYKSPRETFVISARPNDSPRLDWRAAQAVGARLMAEQSHDHGFTVAEPFGLSYDPENGAYFYDVRSSRDVLQRKGGDTSVVFDGDTGQFLNLGLATGVRTGNTVESWLYALHMARVFGRPYQVFVCLLGLVVAMLSVTGVYIWWKKRKGRIVAASRQRQAGRRGSADEPLVLRPELEGSLRQKGGI